MLLHSLLRNLNQDPFWSDYATLVIAIASGARTTYNGIAVVGKAAGKQVNATLASDGNGDVDVANGSN